MHDFLIIYNNTDEKINKEVLNKSIDSLANHYAPSDKKYINYLFTVLYLAMVAEFHYVSKKGNPSMVDNKVKLIGIWQILFNNMSAYEASKWSYYKNPKKDIIPKFNEAVKDLKKNKFKIKEYK